MGSSPTKSATTSPTKTGEMRGDEFWVLHSRPSQTKKNKDGNLIEGVESDKVNYTLFKQAPELARQGIFGKRMIFHGRRLNDEVELFKLANGKESPGLRESLEAKGFTVRSYKPEPQGKIKYPRPSYKRTLGAEALSRTPRTQLEKCELVMKATIEMMEIEECIDIEYGVLADAGKHRKVMLVIRMREKDFHSWYNDNFTLTVSWKDEKLDVIGIIEKGKPCFKIIEEEVMSFFTNNFTHVDCIYRDLGAIREEEERKALIAEKKQAKKHRRQMTASTITSASENSTASPPGESEEAIKTKLREKIKAKKKVQKERRKAKAAEEEEEEEDDSSLTTPASTVGDDDDDDMEPMRVEGTSGTHVILSDEDGNVLIRGMDGLRVINFSDLLNKGSKEDMHRSREEDSGSLSEGSEQTKADSGVDVVQVTTVEEMDRAVKNAKAPIFSVTPEAIENQQEGEATPELQYLGRGL